MFKLLFFVVLRSQHFQDIQVDKQMASSSMQMLVNPNVFEARPVTTFRLDLLWLALARMSIACFCIACSTVTVEGHFV